MRRAKELGGCELEGSRYSNEVDERHVSLASLDVRDVVRVDAGAFRELLLGEAMFGA